MATLADPVPGGAEGVVERAERTAAALRARKVHGVVLSWVDTCGVNRIKAVPVARLVSAARWGVGMSPCFDTFLADDSIASAGEQGGPDGDLRLYPDLDTVVPLVGQPGWAWSPVDRMTQDGEVHPGCNRSLLRHAVAAAQADGVSFKAAFEIEFALGRGDVPEGEFVPACTGPGYGMIRLVERSDFAADLLAALAEQGVDVDQFHPEYSTGQYEVSVGALDPVAAADRSVLVRQTIRAVAQRHGLRVSYAPTVVAGGVGNGGHVHLSAWRDGANLHSSGEGRYGMTAEAESFVAGVVGALPALTAIATPTPASYLRLVPSHWSGAFACWGRETRESAVRIVTGSVGDQGRAANMEVKSVDLAANPYLLLTSVIAAGRDGVARSAVLPEEITGDPSRYDDAEREARRAYRLPADLRAATKEFADSELLRSALGDTVREAVIAVRTGEADACEGLDPDQVAARYRWAF